MEKKKVLFVLLALAGFFIFAAGGMTALINSPEGTLSNLAMPLLHGNLLDSVEQIRMGRADRRRNRAGRA